MPMGEVKIKSAPVRPANGRRGNPNSSITITLQTGRARYEVNGISWSLSADPASSVLLSVTGGGFNYYWYITQGGPGFIPFNVPEHATDDTDIIIVLAAAGANIVGTLNMHGLSTDN